MDFVSVLVINKMTPPDFLLHHKLQAENTWLVNHK